MRKTRSEHNETGSPLIANTKADIDFRRSDALRCHHDALKSPKLRVRIFQSRLLRGRLIGPFGGHVFPPSPAVSIWCSTLRLSESYRLGCSTNILPILYRSNSS